MKNLTEQDAFLRVLDARTGFRVKASLTFLLKLRKELLKWLEDVDDAIAGIRLS